MARKDCYIDHTLCSGAKYSFCDDCKKAQKQEEYKERITKATTPAEVSLAHIPSPSKETCREVNECPLVATVPTTVKVVLIWVITIA